MSSDTDVVDPTVSVMSLIDRNPGLRRLRIYGGRCDRYDRWLPALPNHFSDALFRPISRNSSLASINIWYKGIITKAFFQSLLERIPLTLQEPDVTAAISGSDWYHTDDISITTRTLPHLLKIRVGIMNFCITTDLVELFRNYRSLKEMAYPGWYYAIDNTPIMEALMEHCPHLDSIHIEQHLCYLTESDIIRTIRSFRLKSWSSNNWIGQYDGINNNIDAVYSTNFEIKNIQIREILASSSTLEELTLNNVSHLDGQDLIAILSQ
ncbi:hypothetical protein BGX26_006415, partial [Mortierella sp. AD094]